MKNEYGVISPVRSSFRGLTSITGSGILPVDPDLYEQSPVSVLLVPEDFPATFRGIVPGTVLYAHPDDYKVDTTPVKPSIFVYKDGARTRLFMRASTRISDTSFTAATYVFDTGCSVPMQISALLRKRIATRILRSDGPDYLKTGLVGGNTSITLHYDLPRLHQPANFMGLPMFFLLKIAFKHTQMGRLEYDEEGVARDVCTFDENFKYF
eukprot:gene24681-29824_t